MSDSQRNRALAKAQWVRSQRAELKRALKAGTADPWRILRGADGVWEPFAAEMRLDRFLILIPGVGEVTVAEILEEFSLNGTYRLGVYTFERRAELADKLRLALSGEPMPPAQRPAA